MDDTLPSAERGFNWRLFVSGEGEEGAQALEPQRSGQGGVSPFVPFDLYHALFFDEEKGAPCVQSSSDGLSCKEESINDLGNSLVLRKVILVYGK